MEIPQGMQRAMARQAAVVRAVWDDDQGWAWAIEPL